jgi:hypothetical protein
MLGRRSRACCATSCPTHAPGQDDIREDVVNRLLIQFGDPRQADRLIVASSLLAHLLPFPDAVSPRFNVGTSLDQRFEGLDILQKQTVVDHLAVVLAQRRQPYAGRDKA